MKPKVNNAVPLNTFSTTMAMALWCIMTGRLGLCTQLREGVGGRGGRSLSFGTWKLGSEKAAKQMFAEIMQVYMDGRTDGRSDGGTQGRRERWMDGWMDGWNGMEWNGMMDGWMDGWTDGWMDLWLVSCRVGLYWIVT